MDALASEGGRRDGLPESVARKVPDEYDHDRISTHDLMELGVLVTDVGLGDVEPAVAKAATDVPGNGLALPPGSASVPATAEMAGQAPDDPAAPPSAPSEPVCVVQDVELVIMSTTADSQAQEAAHETLTGALPDSDDVYPFEALDFNEADTQPEQTDPLDQLWFLEVPEADDEVGVKDASRDAVSSDERAMQLALAFLREDDLFSEYHLDLLTDIIRERGWSSVQYQVRGLVLGGYGIAQVHRMFQLTDAWMHCVESDTLAPERWHGGKRLTWLEAAQLLDFLGYDAKLEQIADFLSSEQEVWHGLRRDSGQLATFKNYLFEYRLSPRTQVDDGIWQSNLDPGDTRSFDGTRNPLYSSCWWGEPIDGGAHSIKQMFGAICDPARIAEWLSPDGEEMF